MDAEWSQVIPRAGKSSGILARDESNHSCYVRKWKSASTLHFNHSWSRVPQERLVNGNLNFATKEMSRTNLRDGLEFIGCSI